MRQSAGLVLAGIVVVLAQGGCSAARDRQRGGGSVNDSAFQPGPFGLYEMTRPAGSDPVPEGFQEAERIFEAARKDYEAGRWMEAARRFLQAAKVLPRQPPFHRDTVAAGRVACYRNATSAFLMANAGEEARQVLEALVVEDPACADPIHEEIRRLER